MRKQNLGEESLKMMFNGLRWIFLLDTLGDPEKLKHDVQKLDTGLLILETRRVGIENVKNVIQEAIERREQKH